MKGKNWILTFLLSVVLVCAGCQTDISIDKVPAETELPYFLSSEPAFYEELCPLTDFKGMDVEQFEAEDGYFTYKLINAGKQTFCCGETKHLNILLDGDWYGIEPDPQEVEEGVIPVNTDMSYAVEPGTSRAEKMPIRLLGIDALVPGEYRLVFQGNWESGKMQWVYVPFTIE